VRGKASTVARRARRDGIIARYRDEADTDGGLEE
jgi:hypothetical protein